MKLTDNQKAAYFVGWKPGLRCTEDRRTSWGECIACGFQDSDMTGENHNIPEPDMTLPQNWGRALEDLWEKGYDWELTSAFNFEIGDGFWYDGGIKDLKANDEGPVLTTVLVNTLALLYTKDFE